MQQPEPRAVSFPTLMQDVETGAVKIPQFQRGFVWNKNKSASLLDSLLKGYPIGTFIFWRTKEELRSIRDLGDFRLPPTPSGDFVHYVLDGQQRLTTLFATIKGLTIEREGRTDDFSQMFIDLDADEEDTLVITDVSQKAPQTYISVRDLQTSNFKTLAAYPPEYHDKIAGYQKVLEGYGFSVIQVSDAPLDIATEIFTRINVSGQPLSVFEVMVAKTYSSERDFDLAEETTSLLRELEEVGYGTVPDIVILQAVSALMVGECSKRAILKLDKEKFIDTWPKAIEAIRAAVDYSRQVLRIPVSQLLPYKALVVPLTYFFSKHPHRPIGETQSQLNELLWRASLGGYYSYGLESRLAVDLKRVDAILAGQDPSYDYSVDTRKEFILRNGTFSTNRSFVKAVLCVLAAKRPKSFQDNADVAISNDYLKQANSKNYHHFFPKGFMSQRPGGELVNHVGNITLVDEYLNKRQIGKRAPSVYMRRFQKQNPDLGKTMRTHLVNLDSFGVWENNYQLFLDRRCAAISKELLSRVPHREIDDRGQLATFDDFEEPQVEEREQISLNRSEPIR